MTANQFCNSLLKFKKENFYYYTPHPSREEIMNYTVKGWITDRFTLFVALLNGFDFRKNAKHGGALLDDTVSLDLFSYFTYHHLINGEYTPLIKGTFLANRIDPSSPYCHDNCDNLGVYLGNGEVFEWFPTLDGSTFIPTISKTQNGEGHVVNGIQYRVWEYVFTTPYIDLSDRGPFRAKKDINVYNKVDSSSPDGFIPEGVSFYLCNDSFLDNMVPVCLKESGPLLGWIRKGDL